MSGNAGATLPRFLAPDLDPGAAEVRLPPDESRHLLRVLRLGPGALVSVFDGRGNEFVVRVTSTARQTVTGVLVRRVDATPEPRMAFSIVQAVLKGSAMDDVIRDATMMGASRIDPIVTTNTVKASIAARGGQDRWRRIAIASAKQCRRATVPEISAPQPLSAWLESASADLKLMFVEPSADRESQSLRGFLESPMPGSAALLVGPEGGWTPQEIDAAIQAACVPVTLGPITLRADAVAVAAASVFRFIWEG